MNIYHKFLDSLNLIMQSIFGTDGIRGRFNEEITYSLAYKVGYALASTLEKKSWFKKEISKQKQWNYNNSYNQNKYSF